MTNCSQAIHFSIYDNKPSKKFKFNLDDVEKAAIARLQILKWIEDRKLEKGKLLQSRQNGRSHSPQFTQNGYTQHDEHTKYLPDILEEHNLLFDKNYDILSHFILRLAFTEIEEYTSWFIKHEASFFEAKYELCTDENEKERIEWILFNNTAYPLYNLNDIMCNDLNGRHPIPHFHSSSHISSMYFPFRIFPFDQLPNNLIAQRRVFIRNGYGFVPHFMYAQVLCNHYFKYLKTKMMETKIALAKMKNDKAVMFELSKIMHLIRGMHKISLSADNRYISMEGNARNMKLRHFNIDRLSHLFPLCMKYSHSSLLKYGHLKNNARVHFGLFLKGIGLSLDESLIYFEKKFTKKRGNFKLEYAYLIKHFYGTKGGLKNYSPFNCSKIIEKSSNIGDGDHCGCPFKLFDDESLKTFIKETYNMQHMDININKDLEHQLQCREFFNVLNGQKLGCEHGMDIEDIYSDWNHPNRYFDINYDLQYLESEEFVKKHHRNGVLTTSKTRSPSPVSIEYSL